MSDDEIIAVVQAHKKGKKIQMRLQPIPMDGPSMEWISANHPCWDFDHYEYRVAPEPNHLEEIWLQHECDNIWRQIGWGIGIHFRVVPKND